MKMGKIKLGPHQVAKNSLGGQSVTYPEQKLNQPQMAGRPSPQRGTQSVLSWSLPLVKPLRSSMLPSMTIRALSDFPFPGKWCKCWHHGSWNRETCQPRNRLFTTENFLVLFTCCSIKYSSWTPFQPFPKREDFSPFLGKQYHSFRNATHRQETLHLLFLFPFLPGIQFAFVWDHPAASLELTPFS